MARMVLNLNSCSVGNCPDWVQSLAWFGAIFIYLIIGFLISLFIKDVIYKRKWNELDNDEQGTVILGGIFWPVAIIFGFCLWLLKIIILPFIAATKEDIERLEAKIDKIEVPKEVQGRSQKLIKKFKIGDLVTGIKGNPDNYEHLYEGCVCRVISIDEKGIMKLILINHKDKEAHKDKIGKIFTAPSRNFVLIKK